MTTKQTNSKPCRCQYYKDATENGDRIDFCTVKCYNDFISKDISSEIDMTCIHSPTIAWATVDELNNISGDIESLYLYTLERNDVRTISEFVEPSDTGYILSRQVVNNLPISLNSLTIQISEIPEKDIRIPYGCKLYTRYVYPNAVYPNQYDTMCHLFEFRRNYLEEHCGPWFVSTKKKERQWDEAERALSIH